MEVDDSSWYRELRSWILVGKWNFKNFAGARMSKLMHRCVRRETASWSMFLSRTSRPERLKSDTDADAAYSIQSNTGLSDTISKQVHARPILCRICPLLLWSRSFSSSTRTSWPLTTSPSATCTVEDGIATLVQAPLSDVNGSVPMWCRL